MSIKGNGKYVTTKSARKTDVMRINFQIQNNENITPGYKEVYILIQNPKGKILNKKGTFEVLEVKNFIIQIRQTLIILITILKYPF